MNAERLLGAYERIADAPDAIAHLRRFILDLAVRGKLVRQDPSDEPASELLKRIAKEKARLVRAGEIRDKSALPAVAVDEMPFEIPKMWCWVRFANIADFTAGRTPSRNDPSFWNSGDHAWVSIADMEDGQVLTATKETVSDKARERVFGVEPEPAGTILMSFKLTIGKIARLGIPAFHNEAIISIRPHLADLDAYTFKVLPQFARQGDAKGAIKGATLNRDSLSNILFPLPPVGEQHRIVAKVDELMALCDRLEAVRAERESTRDRFTAASLARLNVPDPDPNTFENHAHFVLDNLASVTTRPDQIKQLRQTILNLAVRGKLVPQDPNDEPAAALLKRVLAQPWKKKRKLSERLPDKDTVALVFPLPTGWTWATVDLLVRPNETVTYGILKPEWVKNGVPTVRVTEMKTGVIDVASLPQCDPARASKFRKTTLVPGDLLISKDGTIGKTAFVPPELAGGNITQHVLRFPITEYVFGQFIRLAIDAPYCQSWMAGETKGVALQGVNVGDFQRMPIPLPPLAEQHRIVAKVDALMALCERLEASLDAATTTRRRLLNALLAETLAPVEHDATQPSEKVIANDAA